MVVSNVFYFHPYLGKWSHLTHIFQMGWNHQLVFYTTRISQNIHMLYTPTTSHTPKWVPFLRGSSGCVGDGRSSPFGPLERWHGHHGGGADRLDFCHRRLPTMNASHWRYVIFFVAQAHHLRKNTNVKGKKHFFWDSTCFFPHGVPASSSNILAIRLFAMPWVNWWIAIFSEWRRKKTTWPTLERNGRNINGWININSRSSLVHFLPILFHEILSLLDRLRFLLSTR